MAHENLRHGGERDHQWQPDGSRRGREDHRNQHRRSDHEGGKILDDPRWSGQSVAGGPVQQVAHFWGFDLLQVERGSVPLDQAGAAIAAQARVPFPDRRGHGANHGTKQGDDGRGTDRKPDLGCDIGHPADAALDGIEQALHR